MHIEYFKIFSDLVEKKSFSEAAKVNSITQSAVSQQLRTMENHFNVLIVDRSQKQFRLTQKAKKYIKILKKFYASTINSLMKFLISIQWSVEQSRCPQPFQLVCISSLNTLKNS